MSQPRILVSCLCPVSEAASETTGQQHRRPILIHYSGGRGTSTSDQHVVYGYPKLSISSSRARPRFSSAGTSVWATAPAALRGKPCNNFRPYYNNMYGMKEYSLVTAQVAQTTSQIQGLRGHASSGVDYNGHSGPSRRSSVDLFEEVRLVLFHTE